MPTAHSRRLGRVVAALSSSSCSTTATTKLDLFGRELSQRPDATPIPSLEGEALEKFLNLRDQPLHMSPPPPTIKEMAAQFLRDGFLHLPACLTAALNQELLGLCHWTMQNPRNDKWYKDGQPSPEVLAQLAPGEDPTVEKHPPGTGWHVKNCWNRRPEYLKFADMEPTCSIVEEVMGADCHLIGMTSWVTGPGRSDQGLHNDYLPFEGTWTSLADC